MAAILTAEDVVRRIAAECAYVDERGGVGIRLELAAAIVRQYGEQFRYHRDSAGHDRRNHLACSKWSAAAFFLNLTYATRKPLNGLAYAKTSKVLIFDGWLGDMFTHLEGIASAVI